MFGDKVAFEDIVLTIVTTIISVFMFLFITFYFSREIKPFKKLGLIIERVVGDKNSTENIAEATASLVEIGTAAASLNMILQDKESFDGLITEIAQRGVKIFQMSILGSKSGDARTQAKAERLVNEGLVKMIKKLHPAINLFLKYSELDKDLEEDPTLISDILLAVSQNKGLAGMMQGFMDNGSLALPDGESIAQSEGF